MAGEKADCGGRGSLDYTLTIPPAFLILNHLLFLGESSKSQRLKLEGIMSRLRRLSFTGFAFALLLVLAASVAGEGFAQSHAGFD